MIFFILPLLVSNLCEKTISYKIISKYKVTWHQFNLLEFSHLKNKYVHCPEFFLHCCIYKIFLSTRKKCSFNHSVMSDSWWFYRQVLSMLPCQAQLLTVVGYSSLYKLSSHRVLRLPLIIPVTIPSIIDMGKVNQT